MDKKIRGMLFTIGSALIYGLTPVLASHTFTQGSNAYTLTFYRAFLVVPVLAVIMLVKKVSFRLDRKELLALLTVGMLFSGGTTLMLYAAYDYVGIGTATTLHFLYPVFVALICRIFFREKLGWVRLLVLLLASGGVMFFIDHTGGGWQGILLALASALTYAGYLTGVEKTGLQNMPALRFTFYLALFNSIGMLLVNIPAQQINFLLPPATLLETFLIAVSISFLAVALLQWGIRDLGAGTASIFCMFEPIASVAAGIFFLSEPLDIWKGIGCVVILGAVTIMVILGQKPARTKSHTPQNHME